MDIDQPITTSQRTATAETQVQQPRTTAASTYRAASSAYRTPQTQMNTQTQDQQQPPPPAPGDTSMPDQITPPVPLAPQPCPACATPSHWPWIIALLVGGGLGWYVGSRKKSKAR